MARLIAADLANNASPVYQRGLHQRQYPKPSGYTPFSTDLTLSGPSGFGCSSRTYSELNSSCQSGYSLDFGGCGTESSLHPDYRPDDR